MNELEQFKIEFDRSSGITMTPPSWTYYRINDVVYCTTKGDRWYRFPEYMINTRRGWDTVFTGEQISEMANVKIRRRVRRFI